MFGKLLPKETLFFDFFEQHAKITLQAAQTLLQFTLINQIDLQENYNSIKFLEHQADEVMHHCIENLHKSFITPLQHDDIFRLISRMDDIMDNINEFFEDCLIYKISSFTPAVQNLARLLVLAMEKLEYNIKGLRDRKKLAALIRETNQQIKRIKHETDQELRKVIGELFEEEKDIRLLIKWKEIYKIFEQAMGYCKDVSNIIESIILEYD